MINKNTEKPLLWQCHFLQRIIYKGGIGNHTFHFVLVLLQEFLFSFAIPYQLPECAHEGQPTVNLLLSRLLWDPLPCFQIPFVYVHSLHSVEIFCCRNEAYISQFLKFNNNSFLFYILLTNKTTKIVTIFSPCCCSFSFVNVDASSSLRECISFLSSLFSSSRFEILVASILLASSFLCCWLWSDLSFSFSFLLLSVISFSDFWADITGGAESTAKEEEHIILWRKHLNNKNNNNNNINNNETRELLINEIK